MENDKLETEKLLRSVLQSCKNGVLLRQLEHDYRFITGDPIPFLKFGYSSLELYLRTIPTVVKLTNGPNGVTAEAVADKSTSHIAELVSRQLVTKSKAKSNKKPFANRNFRSCSRSSNVSFSAGSYSNKGNNTQSANYHSNRSTNNVQFSASNSNSHSTNNNDSYRKPQYEIAPRFLKEATARQTTARSTTSISPPPTRSVIMPNETATCKFVPLQTPAEPRNVKREVKLPKLTIPPAALLTTPSPTLTSPGAYFTTLPLKSPLLPTPPVPKQTRIPTPPIPKQPLLPTPSSIYNDRWQNLTSKCTENGNGPVRSEPPRLPIRDRLSSYTQMLEQYVNSNKLGLPIFTLIPLPEIRGYMASVKIDDQSFSSYPIENLSPDQAREIAAEKAINALALLQNYKCGVVSDEIPSRYKEEYDQNLPDGWLKIILMRNNIHAETHNGRTILYPEKPKEVATDKDNGVGDSHFECLEVYLCHAVSTTSIFVRMDAFEVLGIQMEEECSNYKTNIATCDIIVGERYAAHFDGCWHRVTVMSLHTNKVLCKFIDNGDYDYVDSTSIQTLKPELLELEDQAVEFQLQGLEEYAEHPTSFLALQDECGKIFVAIKHRGNPKSIVLYDTSQDDENENINVKIKSKILEGDITPALPNTGIVCDKPVYISHVLSNGNIYVQIQNECYDFVEELLTSIRKNCDAIPSVTTENVRLGEANYIAKYDGEWYRARNDGFDGDQMKVFFIDFGNSETVPIGNIKNLLPVDEILPKLPPLAFKCKLFGVPPSENLDWNQAATHKLSELALDERVLLKVVIPATSETIPAVEIFKRLQPDNQLIAIKETLNLDMDLFWPKITGCNSISPEPELNMNILKPPELPNVGCYMNVQVSLTASPWNFRCQLYDTFMSFEELTEDMQKYYDKQENLVTMEAKSIKTGRFFACKHLEDKLWYRVQVKGYDATISVMSLYYIDFGDTVVATLNEIQPLINSFKTLPYQAIFCKLFGVSPTNKDWRPEDCVRFQQLVEKKMFVAEVCSKCTDDDMLTLGVKLIDTSCDEMDIDIGSLLVEEGRSASKHPYCDNPAKKGNCDGEIQRFYYDEKSHSCKKFIYTGCDGNENNFHTEAQCMEFCSENSSTGSSQR
uniref:Tudor domain-containing protein 7 n=1 Tax=Strigamia maritima TaxID=126957 RepID=T1J3I9_STRMM